MSRTPDDPESARFQEISTSYYDARRMAVNEGDDPDAVAEVVQLCEDAPDDEHLLVLAVMVLDPLLDLHWESIATAFEEAMTTSAALRKAYSGTMVDIPQEAIDRLDNLVSPSEDIGRGAR